MNSEQDILENLPEFLSKSFLPSPPEILIKIRQADSDLERISKVINADMGLCASVLKTINSPFYGLKNKVISIPQAVTLLGLKSVMSIVNAHLLLVEMKSGEYATILDDFWHLSNTIAETCVVVAKALNYPATEDVYVMGLFHDAGVPMMLKRFTDALDTLQSAYRQSELRITDIENQNYNCNHAVIGYLIAKSWHLPQEIRNVIRDHHNLEQLTLGLSEETNTNTLRVILKISEYISNAHQVLGGHPVNHEWDKIKPYVLEYLGFSEPDFEDLEDYVHEQMGLVPA